MEKLWKSVLKEGERVTRFVFPLVFTTPMRFPAFLLPAHPSYMYINIQLSFYLRAELVQCHRYPLPFSLF